MPPMGAHLTADEVGLLVLGEVRTTGGVRRGPPIVLEQPRATDTVVLSKSY